jgi:hypothetical protein
MHTIAKITPADYPDLLAAVDAGVPQRELARRYECAPSLVARHVARAERARELSERRQEEPDLGARAEPHDGSMREILEARVRDPNTSARDLASLTNALARLKDEETLASGPPITHLRRGTLILEPGPGPDRRYRLMMRVRGGIEHVAGPNYDLTAANALYLLVCALGSALGLTPEAISALTSTER